MKVIPNMKPWEVMKAFEEDGKRVAARFLYEDIFLNASEPGWNWGTYEYAIIDEPKIDWDGFNWVFFDQYGGKDSLVAYDREGNEALLQSPFYPWFGSECPVPGNVEVEVCHNGAEPFTVPAKDVNWVCIKNRFFAFRITGRVS